jgi:monoamine oxidase
MLPDVTDRTEVAAPDERVRPAPPPRRGPMDPDTLATPTSGLGPRTGEPKRVVVIGAGIAGLVAAYELKRAGHEPVVLEAQQRVGGRVYTMRGFAPGLYGEAGAMRIPRVHDLTLGYCAEFGLELRPFVMGNPKALVYVGGQRMTATQAEADPVRLAFDLAAHERGRSFAEMWDESTADLRALLERDEDAGWEQILHDHDQYSLREFLEARGWSEGAIEMYGVMNFVESDLDNAVIEEFRESLGRAFEDMQEIVGGMDLLPAAFYARVAQHVRFGAEATAIEQDPDGVTVHYRTLAGRASERSAYAICTLPFSVLRHVEIRPRFSREKQRAIRQLNYSESTKVLFQVRRRFWETEDGIVGGTTVTDLPVRRIVYPSHPPAGGEDRGVLLASYTWSQDATRWAAMDPESRLEQAIEDVAQIHPSVRDAYEGGASHAWSTDPHAAGAFALFAPGQQTQLQSDIVQPEGRVHFAGEHCSLHHAWIQGALESGIRAAREIHRSPA